MKKIKTWIYSKIKNPKNENLKSSIYNSISLSLLILFLQTEFLRNYFAPLKIILPLCILFYSAVLCLINLRYVFFLNYTNKKKIFVGSVAVLPVLLAIIYAIRLINNV